jgi:ParB family chromosome partitioning protein
MRGGKGLGRGLDALIPPPEVEGERTFMCPVSAISPAPGQPRRRFDQARLEELMQTIKEKGVLSPVLVRPSGEGYELISGERRWRAAKLMGLERIPAIVRPASDREALEISLIENLQREDLSPLEEARAYQALLDLHAATHEQLAARLGKDRSTITNSLRLLKLSPPVQEALEEGLISAGHARCLLGVPVEMQEGLLRQVIAKGLSVRSTERLAGALGKSPRISVPKKAPPSGHLQDVRDKLRSLLGTQVRIVEGKRKGQIIIEYYGKEDLDRVLHILMSRSK